MRPSSPVLTLLSALVIFGAAARVDASESYPGVMQEELDMPCAPPCTVCHQSNQGGVGTIKPDSFGAAVLDRGLRFRDDACIPEVLAAVESGAMGNACEGMLDTSSGTAVDSDQDGTSDVQELREGTDPNGSANASLCALTYGCGARIAPEPRASRWPWLSAASLGLVAWGASRWQRRRTRDARAARRRG